MKRQIKQLSGLVLIFGLITIMTFTSCSQEAGGEESSSVITPGGYNGSSDNDDPKDDTAKTYIINFSRSPYEYRSIEGEYPSSMKCKYDQEYTLPENNLTCTNYSGTVLKARGWTKDKNKCSEKGEYASGAKVKNLVSEYDSTGAVTLYPCFTQGDYTLTFYKDTTPYASAVTIYADKDDILSESQIPAATKKGYDFEGYYLSNDSTQIIIDFKNYKVTGNADFKPKFKAATYTATFVTEHGTAPTDVTWTYTESSLNSTVWDLTKGIYVLTATGYTFDGWKDQDGNTKYSISSYSDAKNLTITAKWTPWKANLVYDKNAPSGVSVSGNINSFSDSVSYNTAKKLTKSDFVAAGYKFTGWNTKNNGTGVSYADEGLYTWKGSSNNETVTLYAQWKEIQLTVKVALQPPVSNQDISLGYDSEAKCFKAQLAGATSYTWYIDNIPVENETGSTLSAYAVSDGQHSIMVTTEFSGRTYGKTMVVSVSTSE